MLKRTTTTSNSLIGQDLACILVALLICGSHEIAAPTAATILTQVVIYACVWGVVAYRFGTYRSPLNEGQLNVVRRTAEAWLITAGFAGLLDATLLGTATTAIWQVCASTLLLLLISRCILFLTGSHSDLKTPLRVLLIGSEDRIKNLLDHAAHNRNKLANLEVGGHINFRDKANENAALPAAPEALEHLESILAQSPIDTALVCPAEHSQPEEIQRAFEACDRVRLTARLLPPFLGLDKLENSITPSDGRMGIEFQNLPTRSLATFTKRIVDLVGASIGVALLLPVLVACALAIKLTSKGPILYSQVRVGRQGQMFRCFKFRTMKTGTHKQQAKLRGDSIQDGPAFKIPNDPRITRVGAWLRRYSLDELPQLFNVLLGDMSLVGPRPPIPSEVDRYEWWQRRRISVVPGLTCVWQVWGRNQVSFKRWVEMDLYYIDNWNLWLDLKLIAHTVRTVVRGTGM